MAVSGCPLERLKGGFILSRGVTHASEGEWKALPHLLEQLPLQPASLAADTAYNAVDSETCWTVMACWPP